MMWWIPLLIIVTGYAVMWLADRRDNSRCNFLIFSAGLWAAIAGAVVMLIMAGVVAVSALAVWLTQQ